jgi:hypothetical protein
MALLNLPPLTEDEVRHLLSKDRRMMWEAIQELEHLADRSVEGEKVTAHVKEVLTAVASPLRPLLKTAYTRLQEQARKAWGITQTTLSREQRNALVALKIYENPAMTALLSPSSLRQLRLLFLSQPELMASITVAGVGANRADAPTSTETIPITSHKESGHRM